MKHSVWGCLFVRRMSWGCPNKSAMRGFSFDPFSDQRHGGENLLFAGGRGSAEKAGRTREGANQRSDRGLVCRVSSKTFWTGWSERVGICKNAMKISIITAVYNGGSSIAETLSSVAQQDHGDIEHIVIDGGSVDCTLSMVRSNNKRIARLISEADLGVYDAFNKGLRVATGDAVAFLNCGDTYVSPTVVTKMVKELSQDGVQAAFGDVSIVDACGQDSHREALQLEAIFSPPNGAGPHARPPDIVFTP